MQKIGAGKAVLGSGNSRYVPEGWDRNRAREQLLELFVWIGDEFASSGLTLAIEPLNRGETNIINSVAEASWYTEEINRDCIRITADLYHMELENEPFSTLIDNQQWLAHVHISDTDRLPPGAGHYRCQAFFDALRSAGYGGTISAECNEPVSELAIAETLPFIKQKWTNG
ncbi:sugar phosphate isomerase/epimerase family protein [Paenibacillus sepulcri]|uniref:sugar phosphate isomerase/epimerase family protein n=1 Tax=Paenibacillus sepulcri TaxID=359917 RepID=UPI0035EF4F85